MMKYDVCVSYQEPTISNSIPSRNVKSDQMLRGEGGGEGVSGPVPVAGGERVRNNWPH